MKLTKKLASLLLALVMALALCVPAFATSGTNSNNGKITIDNAIENQTYTIYQILTLESYNTESGAYAYKATTAWNGFINSTTIKGVYVNVDDNGYVTWVKDVDAAAFAKLAQAYAKEHTIFYQGSTKATTTTIEFTGLNLGYYLVDSTLGTLCSLDTTHTDVTIKEKNAVPTNDKMVEEDSTKVYDKTNDADIGQTVNFKSTITLPVGSENVVFKDQMSNGLTLKADSIKVYTDADMTTELASTNYTLVTTGLTDCTFKITFNQTTYLDSLTATTTTVYVAYTATVNENAVVGLNGNANDSWLDYGDENNTQSTPPSETITYTWDLDVLKYANGNKSDVLKDAQFVLLNSARTQVATVVNGKVTGWADVPIAGEDGTITWPNNTVLTTDDNGKIEIDGLDADTYYLREVKAPAGYNVLDKDVEVKITGATKGDGDTLTYTTVVAEINNQSGTELPSTGGIGTTLFYIAGGVLVVGAAVLLVTKRRMER